MTHPKDCVIPIQWFVSTIKRHGNRKALGHEATIEYNHGMISTWFAAGLMNGKIKNELVANFVNNTCSCKMLDLIESKCGRIL